MKDQKCAAAPVGLEAYEAFGEDYARVIQDNAYNANFERPTTLSLLPPVDEKRVLDAGCGPGEYVDWFLKNGAKVTGIDVSPSMINCAKRRFPETVDLFVHDLAQPMSMFPDKVFDLILSSLTIHYIRDLDALFTEFSRVLKDSGHLIISTHHPVMDFSSSLTQNYFLTELIEEEWNTVGRPVKVKYYRRPLSEMTTAISKAGFMIEVFSEGILTRELKDRHPATFERLSKTPQFIFLRLRK